MSLELGRLAQGTWSSEEAWRIPQTWNPDKPGGLGALGWGKGELWVGGRGSFGWGGVLQREGRGGGGGGGGGGGVVCFCCCFDCCFSLFIYFAGGWWGGWVSGDLSKEPAFEDMTITFEGVWVLVESPWANSASWDESPLKAEGFPEEWDTPQVNQGLISWIPVH